jgi:Fe-Mn family superoxide dismutase
MNKRSFIKTGVLGIAGIIASTFTAKSITSPLFRKSGKRKNGFIQPALPYAFDALEPHIDSQTMEIHYTKHHAAYTRKFTDASRELGIADKPAREILAEVSLYPETIRNNGGGYLNHVLFWGMLSPTGGGKPSGALGEAINRHFGSFELFKEKFTATARSVFGSGWVWLILTDNKLLITSTSNQDNPIMDIAADKGFPILCLDVWEHAYYLKNQNKRPDYISSFWNVVNWEFAARRYNQSLERNSGK